MKFQSHCGSIMLLRDSMRRHRPCANLRGVTMGHEYFLIIRPEREPADAQNEARSDVKDKEEELGGRL